jgi:3-hydroxyacyl-CoA dehydrogenase/enoyl-CoA hydratase/carnithine racemase
VSTPDISALLARAEEISSDAERVTAAHLRKVTLPPVDGTAATIGLITLDNGEDHTRPNTFGPRSLLALNAAIDEALADDTVTAIGVTGKPFILAAGADLTSIQGGGPDAVRVVAELGHAVFRKLGEGGKPSFGFINGLALGGGLEVALHCTYRTVMDSAPALGLPEVMLGLVPGWGGAYLVPQLVGADKAVTLILENPLNNGKTLGGRAAYDFGLADAVFGGADFLEQSLLWAADVLAGKVTVDRPEADKDAWDAAVARAEGIVQSKTGGASPAARKAVELIAGARDADRDAGFAAEDDALEAMSRTPELIASLYAFDLVQKRAKRPAGAPDKALARPVTKVGIVGAGLMASQLALLFVRRLEVPVVLTDLDQERADKGVSYVHAEIDKLLAKGRGYNQDKANRHKALVTGATDKQAAFGDADFVIEAVFEEMTVKKSVFADVEKVVSAECVLATNTSSLSITEMAADLEHPERVVGFHFFNPVAVMPLLEIVRGEQTDDATLATAFATGKALKKTTILVKDSPSFIVNRLLGRFMGEVGRIVDEGTPVTVADGAFAGVAPMPPFMLLSLVGPAIALHNNETLHRAFPDRFYVSPALERVVAAKKGSYYAPDLSIDPEVEALLEKPESPVVLTAPEVRERVLAGLAQEAQLMLDEGVVAAPEDLDLAMITGAGFSFWNGGLTMLLDIAGISEKVNGKRFH